MRHGLSRLFHQEKDRTQKVNNDNEILKRSRLFVIFPDCIFFAFGIKKGLDFYNNLCYYNIVIYMISATDGIKWIHHGETEINIADRLGTLVSYGISVSFFNFDGFYRILK